MDSWKTDIQLIDVYAYPGAVEILYNLLAEREPHQNISHKQMPTPEQHAAFVEKRPYQAWYLIAIGSDADAASRIVGATYLTDRREVGIFIFRADRKNGYGEKALKALREKHLGPLFANIAPSNAASMAFFKKQGFLPIQLTFKLDA